jgi:hypothetical protein
MTHAFVSYSRWARQSSPLIDRIISDLNQAGVRLWLAPDDVAPGTEWSVAIEAALEPAGALLFLVSKQLRRAAGMINELVRAVELKIPIFVLVVGDGYETHLPDMLHMVHKYDFAHDYDTALQELLRDLPGKVQQNQPVPEHEPKSKGYIFISYAEEDSAFVDNLRAFLTEKGYGFWDYQSSERNFHTQLFLELEAVIRGASATISVLSPAWKKSPWTAKEYMFSEEVGVPVFLIMAQPMEPTLVTAGIPYIDFTRNDGKGFIRLDNELKRKGLA